MTRFAPSPSGYLHLGHAYSALFGYEAARYSGGRFLLRIEDIDRQRCRPEFEQGIYEDLTLARASTGTARSAASRSISTSTAPRWTSCAGWAWSIPASARASRSGMEVEQAGRAPHGPSGEALYPGICRDLDPAEGAWRISNGEPYALRLDVGKALARTGPLSWDDCPRRPDRGRSLEPRRRRAGAQGRADQLSSGGDGRRSPAGRHAGHPRRGPVPRHPHPPPAAGAARACARRATTITT